MARHARRLGVFLLSLAFLQNAALTAGAKAERVGLTAEFIGAAPTLDGSITEEEWGDPVAVFTPQDAHAVISLESVAAADQDKAMAALPEKVSLYLRWDKTKLYAGVQVVDEKHHNPATQKPYDTWIGDSLEFDVGINLDNQAIRWRNNFALTADGKQYGLVYGKPSADGVEGVEERVDGSFAIKRDGKTTTYEIAFNWSAYAAPGATIGAGYKLYVNPQLHIADGETRGTGQGYEDYLGFMRYGTKDGESTLFPLVTLSGGEGGGENPAPTTQPAQTKPSPTTGEPVAAAGVLLAVLSAGTVLLLLRRCKK